MNGGHVLVPSVMRGLRQMLLDLRIGWGGDMSRYPVKIFGLLLFLFPFCVSAQTAKTITIKGILKNFSNQVIVEDISDMQYLLLPNAERMVIPDAEGKFQITFRLGSPNYFRLGRNILYLSPGDDLTVSLDYANSLNGDFKGKGSRANMFLRATPFPKAGSYMEAGKNVKTTANETVEFLLQRASSRQKELNELKGVTPEFKRLEAARIKADTINSLLSGRTGYKPKLSADALKIYNEEYLKASEAAIEKYRDNFVDFSLMKLVVYRDIAKHLLNYSSNNADFQKIIDWQNATSLVNSMNTVSDKKDLQSFDPRISSIKTLKYQRVLKQRLAELSRFGKGDVAINFTAVDSIGRPVSLTSLKGKVIYIDLWATWCGPCYGEMPFFEKLKEKYKGNENVAFVSLSIDDNVGLWKRDLDKRKAGGSQWLINRNSLPDYNIIGVPRAIIIDRSFKIADLNGPLPSSKTLEKVLDELVK